MPVSAAIVFFSSSPVLKPLLIAVSIKSQCFLLFHTTAYESVFSVQSTPAALVVLFVRDILPGAYFPVGLLFSVGRSVHRTDGASSVEILAATTVPGWNASEDSARSVVPVQTSTVPSTVACGALYSISPCLCP